MTKMSRKTAVIFLIILSHFSGGVLAVVESCDEGGGGRCEDKKKAWPLKIIALCSILLASMIGVSAPLLTRSIPALSPERSLFTVVKAFASGIILGTGFMHVLPDSFEMMMSSCLKEHPWHEFPFTGLFAMFSAVITLMIDSLATSFYAKNHTDATVLPRSDVPLVEEGGGGSCGGHSHFQHLAIKVEEDQGSKLHRFRVIAMVLEMGIIVHSVVIGLSLGASNNTCSIKGLIAALCFHQMFEGMGLGGCILQAEYKMVKKVAMAFFFSVTTPLGIAVGMLLSESYKETSPQALVTVGLLNASSAGLLIYMALVDLLASDFMGSKLQGNIQLQLKCYVAVFIGAGGMAIMALWA